MSVRWNACEPEAGASAPAFLFHALGWNFLCTSLRKSDPTCV